MSKRDRMESQGSVGNATTNGADMDSCRRAQTFANIRKSLAPHDGDVFEISNEHLIAKGDSLALIKSVPDRSINLILTDPPYHSTKKDNITGDTDFSSDREYLDWMKAFAAEWRRVLRPNGSLYLFCSTKLSGRLEDIFRQDFRVFPSITWTKPNEPGYDGWKQKMKKDALRIWYPHTEKIVFAEPAVEGNLHRSTLAKYLNEMRRATGMSSNELAEITGAYGKVNHGGAISNWETGRNIPSREQYEKLCDALLATGKISSMEPYDNVVRPFNIDPSKPFVDVWDFPTVRPYKGKHPAEKPAELLEHIIKTSSNPTDIVLDCFGGSGSTAAAAKALGRYSVTIEVEGKWVEAAVKRLALKSADVVTSPSKSKSATALPLFAHASSGK